MYPEQETQSQGAIRVVDKSLHFLIYTRVVIVKPGILGSAHPEGTQL